MFIKGLKYASKKKTDEKHTIEVFTRLMLRGQVNSVVRWMTGRASSGGVLNPSSQIDTTGKTVLDVLKEKYPKPAHAREEAFLQCDELPLSMDVDVTGGHVEKVAWKIQGGAGPGGITALQ